MAKSKPEIKITIGALKNMIMYMQEMIYDGNVGDLHADKATHPLEISFLDYLIDLRTKYREENSDE